MSSKMFEKFYFLLYDFECNLATRNNKFTFNNSKYKIIKI